MREVSHFLFELRNVSESRDNCEVPRAVPRSEPVSSPSLDPAPPAPPLSLDPLQSASPETKVLSILLPYDNSKFVSYEI